MYHALFQQHMKENKTTGKYEAIDNWETSPLLNSWGDHEKEISFFEEKSGIHTRYEVRIKKLTYKGFRTGDIPIIW